MTCLYFLIIDTVRVERLHFFFLYTYLDIDFLSDKLLKQTNELDILRMLLL